MVIVKTYYDFKKRQDSIYTLICWSITWVLIAIIAIWPDIIFRIKNSLEEQNVGIGTLFGIAFVFLFYITYRVYIKANRLERKLREIVMKIGMRK
jgi:hypothetical protein